MFKTLAIASIAAMTMGRELTLEAPHFGSRQLEDSKDNDEGKIPVPVPVKDELREKYIKTLVQETEISLEAGEEIVIMTKDKVPCRMRNINAIRTAYDRSGEIPEALGLPSNPIGLKFSGLDIMDEKCHGLLPFDGEWEDAAARFGTLSEYEVAKYDWREKQFILEEIEDELEDLVAEPIEVGLPEDRKLGCEIKKKLKQGCEVKVLVFKSVNGMEIIDAEYDDCPEEDEDDEE